MAAGWWCLLGALIMNFRPSHEGTLPPSLTLQSVQAAGLDGGWLGKPCKSAYPHLVFGMLMLLRPSHEGPSLTLQSVQAAGLDGGWAGLAGRQHHAHAPAARLPDGLSSQDRGNMQRSGSWEAGL